MCFSFLLCLSKNCCCSNYWNKLGIFLTQQQSWVNTLIFYHNLQKYVREKHYEKPCHTARISLRAEPQKEKCPFLFQKKFTPAKKRIARNIFLFGVAEWSEVVARLSWSVRFSLEPLRAPRVRYITDFENRFWFGRINAQKNPCILIVEDTGLPLAIRHVAQETCLSRGTRRTLSGINVVEEKGPDRHEYRTGRCHMSIVHPAPFGTP